MKLFIVSTLVASILLLSYLGPSAIQRNRRNANDELIQRKLRAAGCAPDWKTFRLSNDITLMSPLPGTGNHKWRISTSSDSAAFYFNQGINLYYGFHIIEAIPSFKKAQSFDPECAILYWAEALGYGPNINDLGYSASPEALAATEKARSLLSTAAPNEQALIKAMQVRYSADTTRQRDELNRKYAWEMGRAFAAFPSDAEIGALYADALMLLHPWDLWQHNGQPKPWTNEIISVIEKVLKMSPNHPGANHYYIHAVEASPFPERAIESADKLGDLTPGLSHMVHMPSHIYIRTGEFQKGIAVNKKAVQEYHRYLRLYPEVVNNAPLYDFHNRHMQAACSMNDKDYSKAIQDAVDCKNSIDSALLSLPAPMGPFIQYVYLTPEITMITFRQWNEILKDKSHYNQPYAAFLHKFARAMAYANTKRVREAKLLVSELETLADHADLDLPFGPFNAPKAAASVAINILRGTIADRENQPTKAISYFKQAVAAEDSMIYNEPKDWLLPARHFLGHSLLEKKQFSEAARVFKQDLKQNPKNYISTKGLQAAANRKPSAYFN